ncbi:MAG: helicase-related protein [Actinomycetota bacterium]
MSTWRWWPSGHETVRVLHESGSGPTAVAQVVVPSRGTVERLPTRSLADVGARAWSGSELVWRAAACRAIAALAPPGAAATHQPALQPLPHQIVALERALASNPVRFLFADEVGLGKTIEAGLVLAELKARGRVRRSLVVAPKGVQLQWVAELSGLFGEAFVLVGPGGVPVDSGINPWVAFDQVVCSMDSIKPLRTRQGWGPDRIRQFNRDRSEAVVAAGWDLVIIDEAHHVGGSNEDVARHRLATGLAAASPHLLLLSATPHSGKSDSFARLLGLIDDRFVHGLPLERANVAPLVVRSDKRTTKDHRGKPLFQPRTTTLRVVPYGTRSIEQQLYEAVTDYVRHGYQRAQAEKRPAVGFLVLLMQRLASSSTAAVLAALRRRHGAIVEEGTQLRLFPDRAEEWRDLTGEEQVEALNGAIGAAWGDELAEVELLVDLAQRAEAAGIDAKARSLLLLLDELAMSEADPGLKAVIFTEFTQTQEMLGGLLASAGIDTVAINGRLSIHERAAVHAEFHDRARVLVSTDAGAEGVNLQFAHVVINYDLPWSPSRIEQRIGRVDRIGQTHPVKAINLAMEQSIDARVLEVLQAKLETIEAELGANKSGDILNSAERHADDVYLAAIAGSDLQEAADEFEQETKTEAAEASSFLDLVEAATEQPTIGGGDDPNPWIEMAVEARAVLLGAQVDGTGEVLDRLPEVSPAEPVPVIRGDRAGMFSLWEVGAGKGDRTCRAIFVTDGGGMRPDLADRTWVTLCKGPEVEASDPLAPDTWQELWSAGEGYAIRPEQITDGGPPPGLILRLLVRVCE